MKPLNVKSVTAALSILGVVTFTICIVWDLGFPDLAMTRIWQVLLPGFQGITWQSYLLGVGEIILYALYTALIFVPSYNFFQRRWAEGVAR